MADQKLTDKKIVTALQVRLVIPLLKEFFLEGAFLTLFSGGVGILFAAGVMQALAQLPSPPGFDTPRLAASSAALSVGSLALAGIIAGIYPARKAASLQPVEALRKD